MLLSYESPWGPGILFATFIFMPSTQFSWRSEKSRPTLKYKVGGVEGKIDAKDLSKSISGDSSIIKQQRATEEKYEQWILCNNKTILAHSTQSSQLYPELEGKRHSRVILPSMYRVHCSKIASNIAFEHSITHTRIMQLFNAPSFNYGVMFSIQAWAYSWPELVYLRGYFA